MSQIPVREMIKNAIESLGGRATHKQLKNWVNEKYQNVNQNTLSTQISICTVNMPGRVGIPENDHPREFDSRYDFLYSVGRGEVVFYEPKIHGNWTIMNDENGKPSIAHNGKLVSNSDEDEFRFIEKDFESFTDVKEDRSNLYSKFKILESKLKNTLGDAFDESNSKVARYWKQNTTPPVYVNYQWLGFDRKNTMEHKIFQVSLSKLKKLNVMIWIDQAAKNEFKKLILKQINDNPEKFIELLKTLSPEFYVGINYRDEETTEIKTDDENINQIIEKIKNNFGKNDYHFFIARKYSSNEVIELGPKIINEISKTFKTLVPLSDFLMDSNNNVTQSNFLQFLKQKTLYRNYVPIITKLLLEEKNETRFIVSIKEIRKNFDELNFNRPDYNFHDALRAAQGALDGFVTFSDETASFHLDKLNSSDIPECLKICGQKIAQYHINELTNNEFDLYHILPGSTKENFPYLKEFLETNSIGVGWDKVRDITKLSESQIKNQFDKNYSRGFAGFSSFMKIKPKDIVVLTRGQKEIIDFGIVVGDYVFKDVMDPSYPHRKDVVWLNQGPIPAEDLPGKKLAGFMDTASIVYEKRDMLIEILLGKQTMAAYKAHSCFILTHFSDSKYDDVQGSQYHYTNQVANSRKLISGSKFIIQSKIDGQNSFVGFGKIGDIEVSDSTNDKGKPIKDILANFSEFTPIEPPKIRTEQILSEMQSMPSYGSQPPSILPITRSLYSKITGEDLGEDVNDVDMSEIEKIYEILERKKNVILYGPPGTGKTFTTEQIEKKFIDKEIDVKPILSFFIPSSGGIEKIKNHQEFISKNGKMFWSLSNVSDEKINNFDFPVTGFIGEEKNIIAEANITAIRKREDIPEDELKKYHGWHEDAVESKSKIELEIDKITLCREPFPASTLIKEDGTDLDSTYVQNFAYVNGTKEIKNVKFVTFHPSFSYEDFVEGIRPVVSDSKDDKISYSLEDGIFKKICEDANKNANTRYLLIIDEINRGNIPKIFGELITLLEDDKRNKLYLNLAYSKKPFTVPENLYILGTMNTADKSLVQIDTALRRRFAFVELMTKYDLPQLEFKINVKDKEDKISKKSLKQLLEKLNEILRKKNLRDKQIGHSYFLKVKNVEDLKFVFRYEIIPLLQDYFFGEFDKLADVLGDKFISNDQMEINENVFEDSKFEEALGQIFEK